MGILPALRLNRQSLARFSLIMKIAVIIVRILMGLLFLFAVVTYFFNLWQQRELTGNVKIFMDGIKATGYLMPLIKITELLCGIAFLTGRFVPLATIIIAPVIIDIFLFHAFVDPKGLPAGIFLLLANLFVAFANREKYRPVLETV